MAVYRPSFGSGVTLILGHPGSGKSYYAVRRVLEVIQHERRPVYTNLPLRWRVVKTWLRHRGGEKLAALIRPLSQDGFSAFIGRFQEFQQFDSSLREREPGLSRQERRRRWHLLHGEDVTEGVDLNWIPATSLVVLDEVHHWFPNPSLNRGERKSEPEGLLSYLTMHRHLMHEVWAITQSERQVSTTIKSLCRIKWLIHPRDDDRIVWGIRFRHLGLKGLGYLCYTAEQDVNYDRPIESFTIYPRMPWNRYVFRMYSGFIHAGSKVELTRDLRRVRVEAGLSEDGSLGVESGMDKKSERRVSGCLLGTLKLIGAVVVVLCATCVGGMFVAGRSDAKMESVYLRLAALESGGGGVSNVGGSSSAPAVVDDEGRRVSLTVSGIAKSGITLSDGRKVRRGGTVDGLTLMACGVREGLAVLHDRVADDVWMWPLGGEAYRVGSARSVLEQVEGSAGGSGGAGGGTSGAVDGSAGG